MSVQSTEQVDLHTMSGYQQFTGLIFITYIFSLIIHITYHRIPVIYQPRKWANCCLQDLLFACCAWVIAINLILCQLAHWWEWWCEGCILTSSTRAWVCSCEWCGRIGMLLVAMCSEEGQFAFWQLWWCYVHACSMIDRRQWYNTIDNGTWQNQRSGLDHFLVWDAVGLVNENR